MTNLCAAFGRGNQAVGFTAPYHSYEDLRRQADAFLAKHHPAGTIPVPIEEIVEFQLSIDIVPMPGLHTLIETDVSIRGRPPRMGVGRCRCRLDNRSRTYHS